MIGEDGGHILSHETLNELLTKDTVVADCTISLNAMSGDPTAKTIRLCAVGGDQIMLMLVDSGSTHSFISSDMVARLHCTTTPIAPIQVHVAGGGLLSCDRMVKDFRWMVKNHSFSADLRVVDLGGYDAVLGVDWLAPFGDTVCNWKAQTITIVHNGEEVCLAGVQQLTTSSAIQASADQLAKWVFGNDIWATALVSATTPD
uniref:Uncharacterized protein n=1 Tax=Avena sativa TaxID=4498 RepID=A0ACD5TK13_AVESA